MDGFSRCVRGEKFAGSLVSCPVGDFLYRLARERRSNGPAVISPIASRPARSFYTGFNGGAYGSGEQNNGFKAFTAVQQAATTSILNMYSQVANVTFTQITETSTQSATLRYAESNLPEHGLGLLSVDHRPKAATPGSTIPATGTTTRSSAITPS